MSLILVIIVEFCNKIAKQIFGFFTYLLLIFYFVIFSMDEFYTGHKMKQILEQIMNQSYYMQILIMNTNHLLNNGQPK